MRTETSPVGPTGNTRSSTSAGHVATALALRRQTIDERLRGGFEDGLLPVGHDLLLRLSVELAGSPGPLPKADIVA
jgi:hypothetical protein